MNATHSNQAQPTVLMVMGPGVKCPPDGYGGIETTVADLLHALHRAGVPVILCGVEGSTIASEVSEFHGLSPELLPLLNSDYTEAAPAVTEYALQVGAIIRSRPIDVVHDNSGLPQILGALAMPGLDYPPLISTLHGPLDHSHDLLATAARYRGPRQLAYTAISANQVAGAEPGLRERFTVIHNGLHPSDIAVGPGGDRLLILGRITPSKGQLPLAQYCAKQQLPLDIAGPVDGLMAVADIEAEVRRGPDSPYYNQPDFEYYRELRELIDGDLIRYLGNVSGPDKHRLLGHARALVMPNPTAWPEPFGLVAVEAAACGTPVVANRNGALPELIRHGITGFLADDLDELWEHLNPERTSQIHRETCRAHAERHFDIDRLAQDYIALYRRLSGYPA